MFYDFGDNTTKFGIEVCFASPDAGDGNTAASSTSSRHSRLLEASGFSTHIKHLPPSVSSPRSQLVHCETQGVGKFDEKEVNAKKAMNNGVM